MIPKNKLYTVFLTAAVAGYAYFFYSLYYRSESSTLSLCMIKDVTGYPCPSCGTTRAIKLLFQQRWIDSLLMNPFGIIVALLMLTVPLWIVKDIVLKKETFYFWYKKAEGTIKKPWLASILILLVLLNWIWNIYKHL
jgi:hypothetical protein